MGPFNVEIHSNYQTMEDVQPYTDHVHSSILQHQKFDEVILLLCSMCIHMPTETTTGNTFL
jgi:hypothetical protein